MKSQRSYRSIIRGALLMAAALLLSLTGPGAAGRAEASMDFQQAAEQEMNQMRQHLNEAKHPDLERLKTRARTVQEEIKSLTREVEQKEARLQNLKNQHSSRRAASRAATVQKVKNTAKNFWEGVNTVPKKYDTWQQYHEAQRQREMENSK